MKMSVECRVSGGESSASRDQAPRLGVPRLRGTALRTPHSVFRTPPAFTILELLVVIAILGILGALTVPVLKNFGKSDATLGASRQLLDDVGRARQLALSQRTTVYMVFVPTNFWANIWVASGGSYTPAWNSLTLIQQTAAANLCDKQLTGYTFIAFGAMGDQPGQHAWHYLAPWQALPEGTFIAYPKFMPSATDPLRPGTYSSWEQAYPHMNSPTNFPTRQFPFPTETSPSGPLLPYLAFNSQGQLLAEDGVSLAARDEYIPLAHGSVTALKDATTKAFLLTGPPYTSPEVAENPPGNSTNSAYNIVHIDRLSGRAILEFQKLP